MFRCAEAAQIHSPFCVQNRGSVTGVLSRLDYGNAIPSLHSRVIDMIKCLLIIYEDSSDSLVLIKSSVPMMKTIYKFMRS